MSGRTSQRGFWLALAAWVVCALALAALRLPYDDELFSLELAHDATPAQLWAALAGDVHPPWVALLDRALAGLGRQPLWLQAARVLFSAAAIAATSRALAQPLGVPRSLFVLAALHPLVLFYAGAARWYPLLWLAHALRLSAIWHARPAGRQSAALFAGGSLLGSLATYLDGLFLVHDALWLVLRSAQRQAPRRQVVGCVLGALAACALVYAASPLRAPLPGLAQLVLPEWPVREVAAWSVLGLAGEAALPWPWWILGGACVIAGAWGVMRGLREPAARPVSLWLVTYAGCWLLACGAGVDHARYSLLLWSIVPCFWLRCLLPTAAPARGLRAVAGVALVHLVLGLGLAASGRGFFKADLNELAPEDCAALAAAGDARALFVTYARVSLLVRKRCAGSWPLVDLPSIRIVPDPEVQLAAVRARLSEQGSFGLLTAQARGSHARTAERVRELLTARCSLQGSVDFGRIPHPGLAPERGAGYRRFKLERFACPAR